MVVSQKQYVQTILHQFEMDSAKTNPTLIQENICELLDGPEKERLDENSYPYEWLSGKLLYFSTGTRPDSSFAVCMLRWFEENPTVPHWKSAKTVFHYLVGTPGQGIRVG